MTKVIGVRFHTAGKIYFFAPGKFLINQGDYVIVETARGVEFGHVVTGIREVDDGEVVQPLKSVIRIANEQDKRTEEKNREREKEAFKICQEKIRKHGLEMKLIGAEYTFDNNKVLFYFTADGRIDFRELVKDLAAVFRTRIELRQIGVRDETKIRGGIGICGRPLCCNTYLSEFAAVSIKMAKEQNLSLNPTKISGVCGRLMCCLTNEEETYEELNSHLPGMGDQVTTVDGLTGTVQSLSVLRQQVRVIVNLENDEKEVREYKVEELKFKPRKKKMKLSKEEMKNLKHLEQDDGAMKDGGSKDGAHKGGNREGGTKEGAYKGNREGGTKEGSYKGNREGGTKEGSYKGNREGGTKEGSYKGNREGGRREGSYKGNRDGHSKGGSRDYGSQKDSYKKDRGNKKNND